MLLVGACSSEDKGGGSASQSGEVYAFPALSSEQLNKLKQSAKNLEGFFITTELSDHDTSWQDRGFYLYVCVRVLNDLGLNQKLESKAQPLLIQTSAHPASPQAESILLLHPETKKSNGQYVFYYEEQKKFALKSTPFTIGGKGYFILDVAFENNKPKRIDFAPSGVEVKNLKRSNFLNPEEDLEDSVSVSQEGADSAGTTPASILTISSFAKQFSGDCKNWPVLNYKLSGGQEGGGGANSSTSNSRGGTSPSRSNRPPSTFQEIPPIYNEAS